MNILFVCTGNVCRSPMAEGLFRHAAQGRKGLTAGSAGLSAADGQPASENAAVALGRVGIDIASHRSRRLTREMVDGADALYVMTRDHLESIARIFPGAMGKTRLIRDALEETGKGESEVSDPIGSPLEVYEQCRDEILEGVGAILRGLDEEEAKERRLCVASDHAGYELKGLLLEHLREKGVPAEDLGTDSCGSVDYPAYAAKVAERIQDRACRAGVLICSTGIGMSMAANRRRGIRAALVQDPDAARMSRSHNDANVLCLPSRSLDGKRAAAILDAFLETGFEGGRHARRLGALCPGENAGLAAQDPEMAGILRGERERQMAHLELIASENFVSPAVLEAQGSVLTNKYAEGYPGRRWYGGCQEVDRAEETARRRVLEIFGGEHANVQPHSGSAANMAVYFSALEPGDTILAMDLSHGGHLTHGHKANFSGRFFNVVHYGVDRKSELLDYGQVARLAAEHRPRMITVGASAYPRTLDFARLGEIARESGALLMADIAHIAGLVAAGLHPSPLPHADFVTSTTHKTLRGPRGGFVICRREHARKLDAQVFPGIQGGPLMHVIAAKAVCFGEALRPGFRDYQKRTVGNARRLAGQLDRHGYRLVGKGTDTHLILVDLGDGSLTGKQGEEALGQAGITVNKNAVPFDTRPPFQSSGIRLGTPALTTRGMGEQEMEQIGSWIASVLEDAGDADNIRRIAGMVRELSAKFPLPY